MKSHRQFPSWRWVGPLLVLLIGCLAYCDSFTGPFIFDDLESISNNPQITTLFPPHRQREITSAIMGRPVLRFSLALDYHLVGLQVELYHVTNLLIHLAGGLLLYGIVRRNLSRQQFWGDRFEKSSPWLAAIVAAAWVVHPLNTQAVTYIVQRAESLAGLFYLAVIYCLIRAADGKHAGLWNLAAVLSCLLGVGTKEIVATAPVAALLYDRTFLAGSFAAALRKRPWLYAALSATWVFAGLLIVQEHGRGGWVGFNLGISATDYARTELGVIAHYLRLMMWPKGLTLDYYDWPIAQRWGQITWGWIVAALIVATAIALWKKPWLGFLGTWFFLILAPSSSFVPMPSEVAAEQRMYLSIAAPIALAIIGGWVILKRWRVNAGVGYALAAAMLAGLAGVTFARNHQYADAVDIWRDAVAKRPHNPQAHFSLAYALSRQEMFHRGRSQAVVDQYRLAVDDYRLALRQNANPGLTIANLRFIGRALLNAGLLPQAEQFYTQAMRDYPEFRAEAYLERGRLRTGRSDWPQAAADLQTAIALEPNDPNPHFLLGTLYQRTHEWNKAIMEFERTMQLPSDLPAAEYLRQTRMMMESAEGPATKP